ncbi:MAG TPA: type I phosphomannose isomerase catalytic subunit [Tepidisphaeraceae bacterium]|jgi:mannose-6-phosphate isomerase
MSLYPFKFKPRFVPKIWGGRKIETVLGKHLPADQEIGESWELYDFPPGVVESSEDWVSAQVANGPLAGKTLHQLVQQYGSDLLGDIAPVGPHKQFPILIKFLDAREDLSVQVHPDADYANTHPECHLKTEAWYVIDAEPGSRIYKGIKPGTTRETLAAALGDNTVEQHLLSIPAKPGQCHFLPSGTVHALGAGMLVAEVQTPSDTTFRLYDFNRTEPSTGKPRSLHIEQSLRCIDFSGKPEPKQQRSHVAGLFTTVSRLVTSEFFKIEKVRFTEGVEEPVPYDQPVVWIMLQGEAQVKVKNVPEPVHFKRGETVLLPARMEDPIIKTLADCVWLEVTFPSKGQVE